MSSPEWVVEPHAVARLAAETDRQGIERRTDAETLRGADPGSMAFGLLGRPLSDALQEFLATQVASVAACARSWQSHADAMESHLADATRVEEQVAEEFQRILHRGISCSSWT